MLKNYFNIAWRNILRHKAFTIINISGLTLGVCSCVVIFLVSRYEFSFDDFHPDRERIYHVGCKEPVVTGATGNTSRVPPPTPDAIKRDIAGVEAVAGFYPYRPDITIRSSDSFRRFQPTTEGSDQTSVIITGAGYFTIFPYDWLAGSPSTSLQEPFTVVLSASKARKYFGNLPYDQIIGKEVIYDDSLRTRVTGIVKDWNKNTDFPFTEFISYSTINASFLQNTYHPDLWRPRARGPFPWVWTMIRLSRNTTTAQIVRQLDALAAKMPGPPDRRVHFLLQPLADVHFDTRYSHDDIRKAHLPTLYILMGIALFILMLAVVNFINLSTAQSIQRQKEVGVRKILGGSRLSLVFQFLTESVIVSCFAILLASLLVRPVLFFFREFIPPGVVFNFTQENLVFLFLLMLGTSLLAGLYPAIGLSAYSPVLSLQGKGVPRGSEKWWLRKGLIVFQFTISLIFIISTLVIGRQIHYMLNTDLGIKTDAVLVAQTDWKVNPGKLQVLKEKIQQLPGVEDIVLQGNPPTGRGQFGGEVTLLGKDPAKLKVDLAWSNEEFIPFYGIKMVAGRNIRRSDSLREFVINETCLQALGFSQPEKALGRFLQFNDRTIPIVGVVADFHQRSFHDPIAPLIIGHMPDVEQVLGVRISTSGKDVATIQTTVAAMGKIWKEVYPDNTFEYHFIDEMVASFYDTEQKTSKLARTAMLITIFISCLGLFGLVLFTAHRKTKEIGIRKIIGAGVADIVTLLCKDFVVLVCIAILVASPVAWILMNRWLEGFVYRLPISWWIFAVAGATVITIALLTASVQAIRAALANPVKSLRTE